MRNVSKKYIETMETRRDFYAVGEITFADGTQRTLSKEDFSLTGNSVIDSAGSTSFPLGLLIPKQITLSLVNDDDRWSEYDFYGASIYLQTKFDLDDGTTESLNIGTFTVISPETYGTTVEVTAMDDSYKTDKPYDTQYDYPMSVAVALRDCCSTCDILLGTTSFPNSDYIIPQKPEDLTHRQFIGLCAQIAGGNARFDEYNRLEIIAYDFSPFGITAIDGGTFEPWTKGENYDGGTFNPWTTGDTIDGGTFGDRDNIHVLYQYKSGIVIEVDDVVITGLQMESEDEEGNKTPHLYGKEGYVLSLENQLAVGKEEEVLRRIGEKIVGITFRPFSGDHIALPTAEFMDLAYIIGRKQNVYKSVLTDVTFNYFGYTNLKCTADSPLRNSSTHLSNEVKAIIEAKKMVERERTEREKAMDNLADQLAKSSGLYLTEDVQLDKSVIYYMHDKPTLEESMIVWKLTANAFGISNDGGKTYPYGLDASGVAILERIYAIGLNADYITTGAFEIRKDGKIMVLMDKDTGEVILRPDTFELSSGATIDSIAEEKANSAASGALDSAKQYVDEEVNNFISETYDPRIAELQKQLDGQIESFYYDYEPSLDNLPASDWETETDRAKHEGDLFYWKSKGYAYRFFKDGSTWTWQMVQDTDITKALANAAAAQDTADHKRRVFVATPTTPYDVGDLWVQGKDGDILRCQTARSAGASYVSGDWVKASKYTDDSALKNFIDDTYTVKINELETQADKKAETWYQSSDPSTGWTSAEKSEHTGDLWYNTSDQKTYIYNGSGWDETKTQPPDDVFDKIDGKAQIFVSTPTVPYRVGDLWFDSASSDIMTCIKERTSGSYTSSEWQKRNKYTDDSELTDFIENTYEKEINLLEQQADKKAETWYQTTDPSGSWTSAEKTEHTGDLWYNSTSTVQKYYRWNGSTWQELTSTPPDAVFDRIDGKAQVFVAQPTPPYYKGDLWFGGTSSDVKVCTYTRTSGSYYSDDWEKRDRYIDSSAASTAASSAASTAVNNAMTQQNIFDKLTGGGEKQGIYIEDGRVYVNASYIKSGTLSADFIDTSNIIAKQVNSTNGVYWCKIVNGRMNGGYNYSTENGYLDLTSNITMNNKPLYPVALRAYNNMVLWSTYDLRLWSEQGRIVIMRNATKVGWLDIAGTVEASGYGFINYFYLSNKGTALAFYSSLGTAYWINIDTSDARKKRNILETNIRALDVINAIGHCSFDFIDGGEHWDCGYIAQQLQEVRPEFVQSVPNKDKDGNDTDKYNLFVNSFAILGYATKAIQELSEENETLKSRVSNLEERLAALERRLAS